VILERHLRADTWPQPLSTGTGGRKVQLSPEVQRPWSSAAEHVPL